MLHAPHDVRACCDRGALVRVAVALAVTFAASSAAAHDYWLEPIVDSVEGDVARVTGHLWVGEGLVPEMERGPERSRVESLRVFGVDGVEDRTSSLVDSTEPPFVRLELPATSPRLVHVRRGFTSIELPAERFEAYLRSEGLLRPLRERRGLGEHARPGRERYARCVSALSSPGGLPVPERVFGADTECPIAIVPSRDPTRARPGATLAFSVRFRGGPLVDAAVDLVQRDARGRVRSVRARTDRRGVGRVRVPTAGFSVLRTVTMVRAEVTEADWESWWTSYSFTIVPRG